MATVNINRKSNDVFERYKMPMLQIRTEGTKTILVNLSAVGKALGRLPLYIAKFFSYEFGIGIREDTKTNCYVMSGYHDRETLQNSLDRFIEHFVFCPVCENPETVLVLSERKNDQVEKLCTACGYQGSDNMGSERLTEFLAKHLRDNTTKKPKNKISEEVLINDVHSNNDSMQSNQLITLIETKKNENKLYDNDTIQEILNMISQLNLMEKGTFIIGKHLFTENILQEIDQYKILFQHLCENNPKSQRYLLYSLEVIIANDNNIRRHILHCDILTQIFSKLINENLIERETFLQWYKKPTKHLVDRSISKKIRQMSGEFLHQLNSSDD